MEPTSPKGKDLARNKKYFLHSLVSDSNGTGGEFWLRGIANQTSDTNLRKEAKVNSSYEPADRYILFQLYIEEVGSTVYKNGKPIYRSTNKD